MLFELLLDLVVAGIAGWLTCKLMHLNNSLTMTILLGLVGGIVGNFLFGLIGLHANNVIGHGIVAAIGSSICVWIYNKFFA